MIPRILTSALLFCLLPGSPALAEQRNLESERFLVSYPAAIEEMARSCLRIAEETADSLAPFFGYSFMGRKIVLDLHDESDSSDGAARVRQRYVRLDLRKTRFLWRGETQWLRNVLAHELSHTYTLSVLKAPVYISADAGLQAAGHDWDASASYEHNRLPYWFLEGLAQLGAWRLAADRRDPYREMLLRDAVLSGGMLSLSDMARFERSSRERELVYNQGFAFLLFVAESHPQTSMMFFLNRVRDGGLEAAVQGVFGSSLQQLYDEWTKALAGRYAGAASRRPGATLEPLYGPQRQPFTIEAAASADGRYVIANWGEDFQSFSLYERSGEGFRRLRKETGTVLRQDPVSGSVWFNALVYKPRVHEGQFELFRVAASGKATPVLEGTRCLAFDVRGNRVVFASYRDGITRIEQLDAATNERSVLHVLPPAAAVYDIALLETGEMLAAVGDGEGIRLFRSASGQPQEVWPDVEADITSPLSLGGGRVLFSSTLDGTPQMYAATLGSQLWDKLTSEPGGVIGPTAWDAGTATVVCAVFEGGSVRQRRLSLGGSGVAVAAGRAAAAPAAVQPRSPLAAGDLQALRRGGMLVPATPTWILGYNAREDDYEGQTFVHQATAGADMLLTSSSGRLELDVMAGVDLYLGEGEVDSLHTFVRLQADLELAPGTLSQTLETYGYSSFGGENAGAYGVLRQTVLRTETEYSLPLTLHAALLFGYSYLHQLMSETWYVKNEGSVFSNGESSVKVEDGPLYGRHDLYGAVQIADTAQVYDPARLGAPGTQILLQATGVLVSYYNRDRLSVAADMDPSTALALSAVARATSLLAGRKVSVTGQVRGSGTVQGEVPDVAPPYLYPSLGRLGYATGYDYIYPAYAFAQGEVDVRVSPLQDPFDSVRWYERFSLGFRVEGGAVWTVDQGSLEIGFPLTLEVALRAGVLVAPRREASLSCRVAFPMYDKEHFGTDWDYRVYFSASF